MVLGGTPRKEPSIGVGQLGLGEICRLLTGDRGEWRAGRQSMKRCSAGAEAWIGGRGPEGCKGVHKRSVRGYLRSNKRTRPSMALIVSPSVLPFMDAASRHCPIQNGSHAALYLNLLCPLLLEVPAAKQSQNGTYRTPTPQDQTFLLRARSAISAPPQLNET